MTPTHDELVQFAAGKLGIRGVHHTDNGAYWGEIGPEDDLRHFSLDLTSWDLMGKGMGVLQAPHLVMRVDNCTWRIQVGGLVADVDHGHIPEALWILWYKWEHEQQAKGEDSSPSSPCG